jgi:hypothetical protein
MSLYVPTYHSSKFKFRRGHRNTFLNLQFIAGFLITGKEGKIFTPTRQQNCL